MTTPLWPKNTLRLLIGAAFAVGATHAAYTLSKSRRDGAADERGDRQDPSANDSQTSQASPASAEVAGPKRARRVRQEA